MRFHIIINHLEQQCNHFIVFLSLKLFYSSLLHSFLINLCWINVFITTIQFGHFVCLLLTHTNIIFFLTEKFKNSFKQSSQSANNSLPEPCIHEEIKSYIKSYSRSLLNETIVEEQYSLQSRPESPENNKRYVIKDFAI